MLRKKTLSHENLARNVRCGQLSEHTFFNQIDFIGYFNRLGICSTQSHYAGKFPGATHD